MSIIERHYNAARREAVRKMIRLARKFLLSHPDYDEFVCCMGSCFFTHIRTERNDRLDEIRRGARNLTNLMNQWDDYLKLTGEGVRFTARGRIIRRW